MSGKPLASSESLTGCLRWSGKTRSGKCLPMTRSECINVSSLTHAVSEAKRSLGSAHLTVRWGGTQGRRRKRRTDNAGSCVSWAARCAFDRHGGSPVVVPAPQDSSLTADKSEQTPAREQLSAGAHHTDTAQERSRWVLLGYYWCLGPCWAAFSWKVAKSGCSSNRLRSSSSWVQPWAQY